MTAANIVALLDLTRLNDDDTTADISHLCQSARTPLGHVAAVCVYPQFITLAKKELCNTLIHVATVCNFPQGLSTADGGKALEDIDTAIALGADEIDVVMPYHLLIDGQGYNTLRFMQACRKKCNSVILKIIIESGVLTPKEIQLATRLCIAARVDFVKTSTGKTPISATLDAVHIILETLKQQGDRTLGIKISGGIRTQAQAEKYLDLISDIMGPQWISPQTVRFGASVLLNDLLQNL